MADISQYLQAILSAVYGEDVRGSIHDAIEIINDVSEVVLSTGTAVNSASSSSEGFFPYTSLYFNTNTKELWKCMGTNLWQSQGYLKGDDGDPGVTPTITMSATSDATSSPTPTVNVSKTGTDEAPNFALAFSGLKGAQGDTGSQGPAATVAVGTVSTLPAGSSATVTNAGTSSAAVFNFGIPRGADGSGAGDMLKTDYDSTNAVATAGGIPSYVSGVIGGLDGNITGSAGTGKTLSAFSETNGVVSATFSNISITKSQISDFPAIPTVTDTYSGTSSDAMSGKAVKAALETLDGTVSGSAGTSKTLSAFSQTDGKVSATFSNISITRSQVSDEDIWYGTTATVSSGGFTFSGLDDTKGWGFEPFVQVTGSSTNKNPSAQLSTITGAGTSSMSLTYTTDADNGASVKLRILK